jgi:hypothetical protein
VGGDVTGRPSKFTPELFAEIVDRVSDGEPLAQVCRDSHMPGLRTVYDWMAKDEALSARFARAREAGFDMIAQEALRIADTPLEGVETEESEAGKKTKRGDMLGHRKLQIETRLKLLAKWDPKRYGDRVELAGDASAPLTVQVIRQGDGSR